MDYNYINEIKTPSWQPKPNVFRSVWAVLYMLMFLSLYMFLCPNNDCSSTRIKNYGLSAFVIQLLLNLIWSPIFFYYKKIALALVISVLLTISVGVMIIYFWIVSPLAGILNLPYFLWLHFGVFLNWKLWRLNRS